MKNKNPIFIHAWGRSGTTYLWNVFRRCDGYYTYNEPFNREFLRLRSPDFFLKKESNNLTKTLNHPSISAPYFAEYTYFIEDIKKTFRKEFPNDLFFLSPDTECNELKTYIELLIRKARGRPVFKLVRSLFRSRWFRSNFDGTHIFLFRNPRDTGESTILTLDAGLEIFLILNSPSKPKYLNKLLTVAGINEFHNPDIVLEMSNLHRSAIRLPLEKHYFIFYILWCISYIENYRNSDIIIDIDKLSESESYRNSILEQLNRYDIKGLSFHDCNIRKGIFGNAQLEFFQTTEDEALDFLKKYVYKDNKDELFKLTALSKGYPVEIKKNKNNLLKDIKFLKKGLGKFNYKINLEALSTLSEDLLLEKLFLYREHFWNTANSFSNNRYIIGKDQQKDSISGRVIKILKSFIANSFYVFSQVVSLLGYKKKAFLILRNALQLQPSSNKIKKSLANLISIGTNPPLLLVNQFNKEELERGKHYFSICINDDFVAKEEIEYKLISCDDLDFLYALYFIIHYRHPDLEGLLNYFNALQKGRTTRKKLIEVFKSSLEHQASQTVINTL